MIGYLARNGAYLAKLAWQRFGIRTLVQARPRKPVVINLNANDICNSKCTMCNIWKQKKDVELSPAEFEQVLSDPLFAEVRHVGITGGEPTMREDLPALYQACINALPSLQGLSIITNAIREQDVMERIEAVRQVCHAAGKSFTVMVSVDGFEHMHDTIRGREGNWETAQRVIRFAQGLPDVTVSTGTTISKENVYYVDDLLDHMRAEGIYGRFRLAEFIKRLYNEDRGEVIRNFTPEERYHLQVFMHKVETTFEPNEDYKRTYRNLRHMLGGGKRVMGCPYQSEGIVVDARGDLQYCAPKSRKIGNGLAESAQTAFESQLAERRRLLAQDCDNCLHDYHERENLAQAWPRIQSEFFINLIRLDFRYSRKKRFILNSVYRAARVAAERPQGSLIVGWYGTETVGDKAILGGIISSLRAQHPGAPIRVASLNPYVTERTRLEMKESFEIVNVYDFAFFKAVAASERVIMGGGPLMDVDELAVVLIGARLAKRSGRRFHIFGCGIGPLHHADFLTAVQELVEICDKGTFRDQKSAEIARQWTSRNDFEVTGDPSIPYVLGKAGGAMVEKKNQIAFFLRELPTEYRKPEEQDSVEGERLRVENQIARMLKQLMDDTGATLALYSMHTHFIGGDDRDFYRRFVRKHFTGYEDRIYLERTPSNVEQILEAMECSRLVLAMRFHSVVFAHTLGINFVALDYTAGGKILNFLTDAQMPERYIDVRNLSDKHMPILRGFMDEGAVVAE